MNRDVGMPDASSAPRDNLAERLRAPGEYAALVYCVVASFVVFAGCLAIIFAGTGWLETHPFVGKHIDVIRGVLIGALVAVPATIIGRQASMPGFRGSGIRVGPRQLPELHEAFVRAARALGMHDVPELYVSQHAQWPASAHSAWNSPSVVVLNARLLYPDWKDSLDWLTFVLARALGSIRLGHTRGWVEVLTVYTKVLPVLRTPLLVKWIESCDRCAAFVVPNGIRGLLVEAVGRPTLPSVDVAAFVEQTKAHGSFWDLIEAVRHRRHPIAFRAHALYEAGFFDREDDRKRWPPHE